MNLVPNCPRPLGVALCVALLALSNLIMLLAWYWHLRGKFSTESPLPLFLTILTSWGIAFFEYCVAVPANRLGAAAGLNIAQLKIVQEVVTVCVFIPFMLLFMGEKWRWDYLWALFCLVGAVYFVNRDKL
ncbi:MAG: DMT family protein [Kiritimatiellia bacterium]